MTKGKETSTVSIRLDKWLWAARFYKTRRLAQNAVAGGKIMVNGRRAKPAKEIHRDDILTIQRGPYQYKIQVMTLSERRGPAHEAQTMYQESSASIQAREDLKLTLRAQSQHVRYDPGRPAGRDRRNLRRLKRGEQYLPDANDPDENNDD